MEAIVKRLREDPETRRAWVTIWDPMRDLLVEDVKNYPCTTALQFTCRNDRLLIQVQMRANDAWHGLAYDAFVFGQLQLTVCDALGVEPGEYRHHATSLHLYEPHWELAAGLTEPTAPALSVPTGFSAAYGISDAMRRARQVGSGEEVDRPNESERWYIDKTSKFLTTNKENHSK
jgi:thymidylate synthase